MKLVRKKRVDGYKWEVVEEIEHAELRYQTVEGGFIGYKLPYDEPDGDGWGGSIRLQMHYVKHIIHDAFTSFSGYVPVCHGPCPHTDHTFQGEPFHFKEDENVFQFEQWMFTP